MQKYLCLYQWSTCIADWLWHRKWWIVLLKHLGEMSVIMEISMPFLSYIPPTNIIVLIFSTDLNFRFGSFACNTVLASLKTLFTIKRHVNLKESVLPRMKFHTVSGSLPDWGVPANVFEAEMAYFPSRRVRKQLYWAHRPISYACPTVSAFSASKCFLCFLHLPDDHKWPTTSCHLPTAHVPKQTQVNLPIWVQLWSFVGCYLHRLWISFFWESSCIVMYSLFKWQMF